MEPHSKRIQLQSNKLISNKFSFRVLKALEKYIKNSSLDHIFAEPEIYSPATIEQINEGKHMKRSFAAYTILYVALFWVYMESFGSLHPLIEKELREGIANSAVVTENFKPKEKDLIRQKHHDLMTALEKKTFFDEKLKFDKSMEKQSPYFINFMKMFETVLFVISTR